MGYNKKKNEKWIHWENFLFHHPHTHKAVSMEFSRQNNTQREILFIHSRENWTVSVCVCVVLFLFSHTTENWERIELFSLLSIYTQHSFLYDFMIFLSLSLKTHYVWSPDSVSSSTRSKQDVQPREFLNLNFWCFFSQTNRFFCCLFCVSIESRRT